MNSPGKSAPLTELEHGTVYFKFGFFSALLLFCFQLRSTDQCVVGQGEMEQLWNSTREITNTFIKYV